MLTVSLCRSVHAVERGKQPRSEVPEQASARRTSDGGPPAAGPAPLLSPVAYECVFALELAAQPQ